jgi:hypothetical protein
MSKHGLDSTFGDVSNGAEPKKGWEDEARTLAYNGSGNESSDKSNSANKLLYGLEAGLGLGCVIAASRMSLPVRVPFSLIGSLSAVYGAGKLTGVIGDFNLGNQKEA